MLFELIHWVNVLKLIFGLIKYVDLNFMFTHTHTHTHIYIYIYICINIYIHTSYIHTWHNPILTCTKIFHFTAKIKTTFSMVLTILLSPIQVEKRILVIETSVSV